VSEPLYSLLFLLQKTARLTPLRAVLCLWSALGTRTEHAPVECNGVL